MLAPGPLLDHPQSQQQVQTSSISILPNITPQDMVHSLPAPRHSPHSTYTARLSSSAVLRARRRIGADGPEAYPHLFHVPSRFDKRLANTLLHCRRLVHAELRGYMRGEVNEHVCTRAHRAEIADGQERLCGRTRAPIGERGVRRGRWGGGGRDKWAKRVVQGVLRRGRDASISELLESSHEQPPPLLEDEDGDDEACNHTLLNFASHEPQADMRILASNRVQR